VAPGRAILVNSTADELQSEMPLAVMTVGTMLKEDHGLDIDIHHLLSTSPDDFVAGLRIGPEVARADLGTICGTLPRTLALTRRIKQQHPGLPLVLGGRRRRQTESGQSARRCRSRGAA
jgi:hypothetical protein